MKGSRSLDASSTHSSTSEGSSVNGHKVTNVKQQQGNKDAHNHSHSHSRGHSVVSNNSTSSSKLPSKKSSLSNVHAVLDKEFTTQHVKTNLSGAPIFIDVKQQGNKFLRSLRHHQNGIPEPGRSKQWPYLGYMINGFKNLFLTFYFNWSMIFTAPISSAFLITVYPISVIFLILFEMGLKLFMEKWGGAQVIRYISLKFGQGR